MAENIRVAPVLAYYGNPNIPNGAGMLFLGYTRNNVTASANLNVVTGKVDQVGMSPLATSVWASGHAPQAVLPLIDEDKDKLVRYVLGSKLSTTGAVVPANGAADAGNTGNATVTQVSAGGGDIQAGTYTVRCTTAGNAGSARYSLIAPDGTTVAQDIRSGTPLDGSHLDLTVTAGSDNVVVGDEWTIEVSGGTTSWGIGAGFTRISVIGTLALLPVHEAGMGTNGIEAPNAQWFPAAVCTNFGDLISNLPEGNDAHQPHEASFVSMYMDFDARPVAVGGARQAGADRVLLPKSHRNFFTGSPTTMPAESLGGVNYRLAEWSLPPAALAI